jgi:hypothetical protein
VAKESADFLSDLAVPELQRNPENEDKRRDDPEEHPRVAHPAFHVVRLQPAPYRVRLCAVCDLKPFAFSAAIRTPNFAISLRESRHTDPAGSLQAVSISFAAIVSSCSISIRAPPANTVTTLGPLLSVMFI